MRIRTMPGPQIIRRSPRAPRPARSFLVAPRRVRAFVPRWGPAGFVCSCRPAVARASCPRVPWKDYNRSDSMATMAEVLARETRAGDLYETLSDGRLRCVACGHCCPLPAGAVGVCKVRFSDAGTLRVPWGYVGGVQCDPIEKKPFFHAYPGALAYSFGMLGCDLHCAYCQNWVTSQALRDPQAVSPPMNASPEAMVQDALRQGAEVLVSSYNDPLI